MKGKWHRSNVAKAALVIIAHILVIVITTSFIWIISYPTLREELFAGNPAKRYEDSRSFVEQMLKCCQQAVYGIRGTDLFETEGKYNPDKIVDIEAYYNNNTISGKEKNGLAYRLGDLLEWSGNADTVTDSKESVENIVVCKTAEDTYHYYKMSEFYKMVNKGVLRLTMADEESDVEFTADGELLIPEGSFRGIQDNNGKTVYVDCWVYDGYRETERFAPVSADDVIEIANDDPRWNGRLDEAYDMIRTVRSSLQEQYGNYQSANINIEEGDTNFSYIYADTVNKRVYTNKSEYRAYENLAANIERMKNSGKYIIIKPKLADFETDMEDVDAALWRDTVKYAGLNEDNFVFIAVVDTKYPVQDVFYTENKLYAKYGAGARQIAVFGCAAVFLFAGCLLWLAAVAGRSDKDGELYLNAFDRWKTEIAAVFIVAVWIVPVYVLGVGIGINGIFSRIKDAFVAHTSSYVIDAVVFMVIGSIAAAYTCSMFLVGFLSLVRRIKAKTLWKNSVCRGLFIFIRDMFDNLNCIWKTMLIFGLFVLVHWGVVVTSTGINSKLAIFMILIDAVALVYLVYVAIGRERIKKGICRISGGEVEYEVPLDKLVGDQKKIAQELNSIGEGLERAVAESMKSERLKTDLITNVSHDIKTPLTSIINYVELLKQEHFEDPKLQRYIEVLEQKSQRLKTLTEDVVEASKISSGNISIEYMNLNLTEMIQQVSGEFEEKFQARNLREVLILPEEEVVIRVDGRRMWRVFENIYNNAAKYAMEGTRIYAELAVEGGNAVFSLKNISEQALNISADELTERFIRGDISRSTEGSGLGLSIAKTLTQMQGGTFELYLDGDLFKVIITFLRVK